MPRRAPHPSGDLSEFDPVLAGPQHAALNRAQRSGTTPATGRRLTRESTQAKDTLDVAGTAPKPPRNVGGGHARVGEAQDRPFEGAKMITFHK